MEGVGLTCLSTALNNPPGRRKDISQKNMFSHKPILLLIYFSQALLNINTYIWSYFYTFYTINCIFFKA